jgi:hypothetical protein
MEATANANSGRALALARRKAMSSGGKAALGNRSGAAAAAAPSSRPPVRAGAAASAGSSARKASLERRRAMSTHGKQAVTTADRVRGIETKPGARPVAAAATPDMQAKEGCGCGCGGKGDCGDQASITTPSAAVARPRCRRPARLAIALNPGKAAALARRRAQSTRGKAGISSAGMSEAQTARAANPQLTGRELARALREQRSRHGSTGQKKSAPTGRRRKAADSKPGAAKDAPWKVGASETTHGQTVTGTMVGRSHDVTGDEPSTCRGITGTEYLGADIFREFCQSDPGSAPRKVSVTSTSRGNAVSGNRIGRGENVTGNEPGTCKRVTGDEYISAEQSQGYCGEFLAKSPRKVTRTETRKGKTMTGSNVGRSEKVTGDESGMNRQLTGTQYTQPEEIGAAPAKVGKSATLRGGNITGTMVGRGQRMTGDEPGSCRDITGDDYIGQEQYSAFCNTSPAPIDRKVGVSATGKGMPVTGTMTDRESKVTGNEPGTCKAVTGTPYAGADAYGKFCTAEDAAQAGVRTRQSRATPGMPMTGIQPGVGGKMTGDHKGVCEPLTGSPYVGADQFAAACPATPADSASPDFPQSLESAPWQQFSVSSPSGGAQGALGSTGVTGSSYEQGNITGPFGMAPGKVTGTEEARFGHETLQAGDLRPQAAAEVEGRVKSRITGEGQDAGLKITGDDWDRGNNVTGTEGTSATRRNPTMRAAPAASMSVDLKRNKDMTLPMSKVTGGSGNTERGSLVTYSGGARG